MEEKYWRNEINRCVNHPKLKKKMQGELRDFCLLVEMSGSKVGTVAMRANMLLQLGKFLAGKKYASYKQVKKKDLEEYLSNQFTKTGKKKAPATMNQIKASIKIFYRWLLTGKKDTYPPLVSWIQVPRIKPPQIDAAEMIQPDEFLRLLGGCTNQSQRVLLQLALETGARAEELLHTTVGDVHTNGNGTYIDFRFSKVAGAEHKVYLYDSVQDLLMLLNMHPCRNDPQSPLFLNTWGTAWGYSDVRRWLERTAKKVGLENRSIRMHRLRHACISRAAALGMSTPMAIRKFSWLPSGSGEMYSRYSHISSEDVAEWDKKVRGLASGNEKHDSQELKRCLRCQHLNPWTSKICVKCGLDLSISPKTFEQMQNAEALLPQTLAEMRQQLQELTEKLNQMHKP